MAYQTLKVAGDDGTELEVKIEPRDALIWEKTGRDQPSILEYLARPSMVEAYRLTHIAMKRQHQYEGTLQEFHEKFDVKIAYDDPEPDPTEAEA